MCGIFGYFNRKGESLCASLVEAMGETICHRGPDGTGVFARPGHAIGNMRLAIIDLAGGDQPFVSEDRSVAVVQNGEIYNYIELRQELQRRGVHLKTQSDTEVLLHLYLLDGISFLDQLNGMFAIAISDEREKCLFIARDPLGVKPMFFHDDGKQLLFGSEIKAILRAGVERKLDHEALHHYLSYGFVPPPHTLFQNIRHLMPGCVMRITDEGTEVSRWWDLADQCQTRWTLPDFKSRFLNLLDQSVKMRMRADVPFGAFLSGGLDSSSVVGLMVNHSDQPIKTFSIGFHDPRFDESTFGQIASERFGTHHHIDMVGPEIIDEWAKVIYHCDQPHSDVSFLPTYRLSQLAVRDVKMVLTGDGGDELFGGYEKYTDFFVANGELSREDFARRYHDHIVLFTEEQKLSLYSPEHFRKVSELDSTEVTRAVLDRVTHFDQINQALFLDASLLLPGNNLVKPDRMAMAVSLEARDPFLDRALTEFAFSVPGEFKTQGGVTRFAYKESVRELLGDELTYRKKRMFTVPIGEWFRDILRPLTRSILCSASFESRGIFDQTRVREILNDHETGTVNHTREIRQLLAFEIWCRIFLDQSELSTAAYEHMMELPVGGERV